MSYNPFDEFKKIEEMFRKMMNNKDLMMNTTSRGISIQKTGDETKINVHGDISKEEIKRLKKKYPNANISVKGKSMKDAKPVEVLDDKVETEKNKGKNAEIEEEDEEEIPSEKLALKRFKEKQKKKED